MRYFHLKTKFLSLVAVLLATSITSVASQENAPACAKASLQHNQCTFEIPSLKSGKFDVFDSVSNSNFSGSMAVSCSAGTLIVGKASCGPSSENDCAIGPANWYAKDGSVCKHKASNIPLKDGGTLALVSSNGGEISYSCEAGKTSVLSAECPSESVVEEKNSLPLNPRQFDVTTSTQSTSTKTEVVELIFDYDYAMRDRKDRIRAQAFERCNEIDGFDVRDGVEYEDIAVRTGRGDGGTWMRAKALCTISRALRCDQDIVSEHVSGVFDGREYTKTPTATELTEACEMQGYTKLDRTLYLKREFPEVIDDYRAVLVCSGKQSQCDSGPELGTATLGDVRDCFSANANNPLVELTRGQVPNVEIAKSSVCEPLGFSNATDVEYNKESESGGFEYFNISAMCTDYQDSDESPLLENCGSGGDGGGDGGGGDGGGGDGGGGDGGGGVGVSPVSCDEAMVIRIVSGGYNGRTGFYDLSPTDSMIESQVCNAGDYSTLERVVSVESAGPIGGNTSAYHVEAVCSGYKGEPRSSCETLGPCYGDVVPNPSQTNVKTKVLDGVHYVDLCFVKPPPPSACIDCTGGNFTFNGSGETAGNSCTVVMEPQLSGEIVDIAFSNDNNTGTASVRCNQGNYSITGDPVCYKTCPGNVSVGWRAGQCSQIVPDGTYTHEERVTLNTSIQNTGNATVECDGVTGEWKYVSGQCLLDCNETASWGAGFANDGTNKNGLCRNDIGRVPHNASGNVSSETSGTSGSSSYSCSDGTLSVAPGSCNVSCDSQALNWGIACRANSGSLDHNLSRLVSHSSNNSHPYPDSISGSIRASCDDGSMSTRRASCEFVNEVIIKEGEWAEYDRSCTISPLESEVEAGVEFTQTEYCDVYFSRLVETYHNVVSVPGNIAGEEILISSETEYRTDQLNTEKEAIGTKRTVVDQGWGPWGPWVTVSNEEISRDQIGSIEDVTWNEQPYKVQTIVINIEIEEERRRDYVVTYSSAPLEEVTNTDVESRTERAGYEIYLCRRRTDPDWVLCPLMLIP
jgi:uncharacterized membrane protein YgcG